MTTIVAGAAGFLGRVVVAELIRHGHRVMRLTRADADITDPASLARLDIRGDVLVNAAARTPRPGVDDTASYYTTNAWGADALTAWALDRGVRRVVHLSTLSVIPRPWPVPLTEDCPSYASGPGADYPLSKSLGEALVASRCATGGVPCAVLRLSALYGPAMAWHGVVPQFVQLALAGRRLLVNGALTTIDLLHVNDAARAVAAAAECDVTGVINVATGQELPLRSLAEVCLAEAGRDHMEYDVVDAIALSRAVVAVERMRLELGVAPCVSIEGGIRGLIDSRRPRVGPGGGNP